MTTAELIKQLQEADPAGTAPVTLGNRELYTVEHIEAYWDGPAQLHIVDEAMKPYWHIAGMRVTQRGTKVRLSAIGVEEFIENFPEGPVELELSHEFHRESWTKQIEQWRQEMRQIRAEIEAEREKK